MPKKQNKSQEQPQVAPQADPVDDTQGDIVRYLESTTDTRFTIDKEFSKLFALPTLEQYNELRDSLISEKRCREKLTIGVFKEDEKGKEIERKCLIDGHTRLSICEEQKIIGNEIKYEIDQIQFTNRDKVRLWILQNQLSRRNLNGYQRVEAVLKFKSTIAKEAKEHQQAGGGAVKFKLTEPGINTRDRLAELAGVSTGTVRKVEIIQKKATENEKERLRSGNVSINGIFRKYDPNKKNKPKTSTDIGKNRPSKKTYRKKFSTILTSLEKHEESITEEERVEFWEGLLLLWLLDDSRLGADENMKKLRDTFFDKDKKESD